MGTTLRELIDDGGQRRGTRAPDRGGHVRGREPAHPRRPDRRAAHLRGHEGHRRRASGVPASSCSTTQTDFTAVAAGVARFLAVESCGQCAACKGDGLAIADVLAKLCASEAEPNDLEVLDAYRSRPSPKARAATCRTSSRRSSAASSSSSPDQVAQHQQKTARADRSRR